jgi:hypothetical protein
MHLINYWDRGFESHLEHVCVHVFYIIKEMPADWPMCCQSSATECMNRTEYRAQNRCDI